MPFITAALARHVPVTESFMLPPYKANIMPRTKPTSSLLPFDCGNCDDALSRRCEDCERVYKAGKAKVDPLASKEIAGWIEADLYPPT